MDQHSNHSHPCEWTVCCSTRTSSASPSTCRDDVHWHSPRLQSCLYLRPSSQVIHFTLSQTSMGQLTKECIYFRKGIYSVSAPNVFMTPTYKLCWFIAHYYVKVMHVRVGVIKHIFPLSWGPKQKRSQKSLEFVVKILNFVI